MSITEYCKQEAKEELVAGVHLLNKLRVLNQEVNYLPTFRVPRNKHNVLR